MFGKQYEISRGWHAAPRLASAMFFRPSYGIGLHEDLDLFILPFHVEALESWL